MESLENQPQGIQEQVQRKMRSIMDELKARGQSYNDYMNAVADYAQDIRQKYPASDEVRAYNKLIGNSSMAETLDDFPGEDSVLVFLESVRKKLLGDSK